MVITDEDDMAAALCIGAMKNKK